LQTEGEQDLQTENFIVLRLRRNTLKSSDVGVMLTNRQMAALQVAWRDPLWDTSVLLKSVGVHFGPGFAFVSRRGIRQRFLTFGAHPQPRFKGIFEINPYIDVNIFTDHGWQLESREISPGFGVRFLNSSALTLEISNRSERLTDTTAIAGADVSAGAYDFTAVRLD